MELLTFREYSDPDFSFWRVRRPENWGESIFPGVTDFYKSSYRGWEGCRPIEVKYRNRMCIFWVYLPYWVPYPGSYEAASIVGKLLAGIRWSEGYPERLLYNTHGRNFIAETEHTYDADYVYVRNTYHVHVFGNKREDKEAFLKDPEHIWTDYEVETWKKYSHSNFKPKPGEANTKVPFIEKAKFLRNYIQSKI